MKKKRNVNYQKKEDEKTEPEVNVQEPKVAVKEAPESKEEIPIVDEEEIKPPGKMERFLMLLVRILNPILQLLEHMIAKRRARRLADRMSRK